MSTTSMLLLISSSCLYSECIHINIIDPKVYHDLVRVVKPQTYYMEIGDDPGLIVVCYSDPGAELKSDNGALIDTET